MFLPIPQGDYTPLLPAKMQLTGEQSARVAICEGRYHQVRRGLRARRRTVMVWVVAQKGGACFNA